MDTIELNGHTIEVLEIHEELPLVKFKFVRNWCKITDAFIPNMTAWQWLSGIGAKGFWNQEEKKGQNLEYNSELVPEKVAMRNYMLKACAVITIS